MEVKTCLTCEVRLLVRHLSAFRFIDFSHPEQATPSSKNEPLYTLLANIYSRLFKEKLAWICYKNKARSSTYKAQPHLYNELNEQ